MKRNLFLLCFCLVFLSACQETSQQSQQSTKCKMQTVTTASPTITTDYAAVLRGCQSVEIRPQVSGTITEICINEGDMVRKGQTLFIIDQTPYQAALNTAQAKVKKAKAQEQTARLTLESKEELRKEEIISDFDLQTARHQLLEAEASVAQAEAEAINAQNNLSYTEVKSPVNGVASMIPYRPGALVNSNIAQPLVTVSDDSKMLGYFSMPEKQMLDLLLQYGSLEEAKRLMPAVELTLSNGKKYNKAGHVDAISGTVDKNTGVITLRASFDNPGHLLRNGSTGVISIPSELKDCIIIPQSATYELQDRIFAWKVVDGKTQSTPLKVYKYNDGTSYIVEEGLNKGDIIVAEGAGLLREGTPVTPATSEHQKPAIQ